MKVNLAEQALSSSVADALEYCEGKLKLPCIGKHGGHEICCSCEIDNILVNIIVLLIFLTVFFVCNMLS
jgi:hypothetical protein